MPLRKTFRKPRTGKFIKRTARKPRPSAKRGATLRTGKLMIKDTTVEKINPGRDPKCFIKKSLTAFAPFSPGVLGVNGGFMQSQTVTAQVAMQILFDPAGNTNISGNSSFTWVAGNLLSSQVGIPQWAAYAALYDMYKVTKITARFNAYDIGSLDNGAPVIYVRYNNKFNASAPIPADLSDKRGWIKKTFTSEHPNFAYSIYPKVMQVLDNNLTQAPATDARRCINMPWTMTSTPIEIYGLQFYAVLPGTATTTSYNIDVNYEYSIAFKHSD